VSDCQANRSEVFAFRSDERRIVNATAQRAFFLAASARQP